MEFPAGMVRAGWLSSREISEKLNHSLAGVGVWFCSTGKRLTTKIAPGHYTLKS